MDRPAREKIILLLGSGMLRKGDALNGEGELKEDDTYLFLTKKYKGELADQILALKPTEEEIRKAERERAIRILNDKGNICSEDEQCSACEELRQALKEE